MVDKKKSNVISVKVWLYKILQCRQRDETAETGSLGHALLADVKRHEDNQSTEYYLIQSAAGIVVNISI